MSYNSGGFLWCCNLFVLFLILDGKSTNIIAKESQKQKEEDSWYSHSPTVHMLENTGILMGMQ